MSNQPERVNIYEDYIIRYLNGAQEGDDILFVSPSTFFGFYSLGAQNFEKVCDALKNAKARNTKIKVLVDIRDLFSAKAAEGLLSFLTDGIELRNLQGNTDIYSLLIYRGSGGSRYVEFTSKEPREILYLRGINIRPFDRAIQVIPSMDQETAVSKQRSFEYLWNNAPRIGDAIREYTIDYRQLRRFALRQSLYYVAITIAVVSLFGVLVLALAFPEVNVLKVLGWAAGSLFLGVIASVISHYLFVRRL